MIGRVTLGPSPGVGSQSFGGRVPVGFTAGVDAALAEFGAGSLSAGEGGGVDVQQLDADGDRAGRDCLDQAVALLGQGSIPEYTRTYTRFRARHLLL